MQPAFITRTLASQRGIATLIAIIALLIMTIAVLALVRSSDTSSQIAGNFAFRRDLTNQAQIAVSQAGAAFATGGLLATEAARQADNPGANYSATMLSPPTAKPSQGIPSVLLASDYTFDNNTNFTAGNFTDNGVTLRYVIDRLCTATGPPSALTCVQGQQSSDKGGTAGIQKAGGSFIPVYRITIRASGPHNTQAFLQSTLVD